LSKNIIADESFILVVQSEYCEIYIICICEEKEDNVIWEIEDGLLILNLKKSNISKRLRN